MERIPRTRPDVAVLDVRLGEGVDQPTGIEVCRDIRSAHPEVACVTRHHLAAYLIVAALGGALGAPVGPALDAALVRVVPPEQFQQAMTQDQMRQQVGSLLGPGLGGLGFGLAAWLPFSFDGVTYLVSAVSMLAISADLRIRGSRQGTGDSFGELTAGIRWMVGRSRC